MTWTGSDVLNAVETLLAVIHDVVELGIEPKVFLKELRQFGLDFTRVDRDVDAAAGGTKKGSL